MMVVVVIIVCYVVHNGSLITNVVHDTSRSKTLMKLYSIAYVRKNLKSLLKEIPFGITRYGIVIAKVVGNSAGVVQDTSVQKPDVMTHTPVIKPNITMTNYTEIRPVKSLCKHGSLLGLCKHGCV
jgi:hypothetical protein